MAEGGDSATSYGRGRGLRHGKPVDREPLRRPYGSQSDSSRENSTSEPTQCNESVVSSKHLCGTNDVLTNDKVPDKKSALSAAAPEFIPRSCLTIAMPSRVPQAPVEEPELSNSDTEFLLAQLNVMMNDLAASPGKFDLIASTMLEMLTSSASSTATLTAIVNTIFERSVLDANLRYNGARLCNYLSQNVLTEASEKTFRQVLLQRCQIEHSKRVEYVKNTEQTSWMHGLAHFFGELFIHLQIGPSFGEHICRVNILGICLCEVLELLLNHPNESNLKCVGQVLKFTGAVLEDEQLNGNSEALDKLMQKIKDVSSDSEIIKSIRDMFVKIVELRGANWGRSVNSPVHHEEPFIGDVPCGDAVLYGPDGQPLTAEESTFLESDQYLYDGEDEYAEFGEYGQGEEWSTEDDQMDDEMAAAYEEFLAQHVNGPQ